MLLYVQWLSIIKISQWPDIVFLFNEKNLTARQGLFTLPIFLKTKA